MNKPKPPKLLEPYPFPEGFKLKNGKFNGKGKAYWQSLAQEDVIRHMLRFPDDPRNVVTTMAHRRMMQFAYAESRELVEKLKAETERIRRNLSIVLRSIVAPAPKKARPKKKKRKKKRKGE